MLERVKLKIYDVLVDMSDDDVVNTIVAAGLMVLIVLNVIAVILESVDSLNTEYGHFFAAFEAFSVAVFTIEYIFRLWIAPLDERYTRPVWGRLKYALTPMALIDLIAILPAILPMFIATDLRIIRALRVMRIFRLLKMPRYVQSLTTLDQVVRSKKEELIVTTTMIAIMLIFAGSLMYLIENEVQPDKFPDIPLSGGESLR